MKNLMDFFSEPWPWYVAGPLLGLIVPLLLLLSNKQLGISSSFQHVCAAVGFRVKGYFSYDWKKQGLWQVLFVLGVVFSGAFVFFFVSLETNPLSEGVIATIEEKQIEVTGFFPKEYFNTSQVWILIVGGLLIGFGSRYAGGCTGGHAIMGVSLFAKSSILSLVGFFIGGVVATYLLVNFFL